MFLIIVGVFIVIIILWYVLGFNKLTKSRQSVVQSWSDIDVQLKRRHDLIPNLVTTVEAYAGHEKDLFEQIAQIRAKSLALNTNDIEGISSTEQELAVATHSLLALAESYPKLKANDEYLKLQKELVETEDEIASARRIYNENVKNYNSLISVFPTNIIAGINHFTLSSYFQNG